MKQTDEEIQALLKFFDSPVFDIWVKGGCDG